MKKVFVCLAIVAAACGSPSYDPGDHLSVPEQDKLLWEVMRYAAKPPENITFAERFYKGYDDHYREQMRLHRLDAYYVDKDGTGYFLISRIAPSLTEKRVAIGGKLRMKKGDGFEEYEEVFRTWKMTPDTLVRRGIMLFDKMVKGDPLEPFYTRNSNGVDYIEFPDDHTYFDKATRVWKTR